MPLLFLQLKQLKPDKVIDSIYFALVCAISEYEVCLRHWMDMSLPLVWIDPISVNFTLLDPLKMIAMILYLMMQELYWPRFSNCKLLPRWVTVTDNSYVCTLALTSLHTLDLHVQWPVHYVHSAAQWVSQTNLQNWTPDLHLLLCFTVLVPPRLLVITHYC